MFDFRTKILDKFRKMYCIYIYLFVYLTISFKYLPRKNAKITTRENNKT